MVVMRNVSASVVVFLFCVLAVNDVAAVPAGSVVDETDFSQFLPNQPMFSVDTDIYLGQKRRQSNNGRVWANAYYGGTTLKPKDGGKINPSLYGFQVGFDVPRSHGIHSTYFLNVNQSKIKFSEKYGGGSSNTDSFHLGYGKLIYKSMCHFAFIGSTGYDKYEVSRGSIGNGDGMQMNFFGEFGLDFMFDPWAIRPFYALQYDFLYHGNIGQSSVLYSDWNGHGLQQLCGVRMNWQPTQQLELQGRIVWVHEMLDNPPPFYRVRFSPVQGIHTPAVAFHEGNTGRDWAWLGIGIKLGWGKAYLFLDYDALINERHNTHLGSFGLCLGW